MQHSQGILQLIKPLWQLTKLLQQPSMQLRQVVLSSQQEESMCRYSSLRDRSSR